MGSCRASYGVVGMCALVMAMMIMAGGVAGQGPAAAPSTDCDSVVVQLVDCLAFVAGTVSTPTATCCSNLSAIIDNTPTCLCQLYNTTFTEPLGINVTRAMMLPPACKLTTPDPSLCSLVGVPVPGPVAGPISSASPGASPAMAPTPSSSATPSAPSSAATPPAVTPPVSPVTPPSADQTPPAAASPPNPSSASTLAARGFAAAACLVAAFALFLH